MSSARLLCAASFCLVAPGAHALTTGDIAFTAFNADEDGWAIVALTELAPDSIIRFTDSNWDGAAFTSAEGFHVWNTGTEAILAGTVVRFSQIDSASRAASIGSLSGSGNAALSSSGDTLYAYLGDSASAPTLFLAGVSSESASAAGNALSAAGLTAGATALVLPASTDYASFQGTRSGAASFADYRAAINDAANWTAFTDGAHADAIPDLTPFTVSAVPEASSLWMMLGGLGLLGLRRKR